jgi:uncharacterized protein
MLLRKYFSASPALARTVPFVVILLFTVGQGMFGPASAYWFYLVKILVGLWLILEVRPFIAEMRWSFSWEAVAVGVAVCAVWVGINGEWTTQNSLFVKLGLSHPSIKPTPVWNPLAQFGPALGWFFIAVRILGSALIVPPIEEAFYRSFVYRYIANPNFTTVPLNKFLPVPFWCTALVFGFSHNELVAAIFCGAAYQWLVLRKNHLGDAMTAHAITNFLLGVWVVWRHAWNFW